LGYGLRLCPKSYVTRSEFLAQNKKERKKERKKEKQKKGKKHRNKETKNERKKQSGPTLLAETHWSDGVAAEKCFSKRGFLKD